MTTPHRHPARPRAVAALLGVGLLAVGLPLTALPAGAEPTGPPTAVAPTATTAPDYRAVTPTGPYRAVATGRSGSIRWRLLRAPGTLGTTCWRITTSTGRPRTVTPNGPQQARCLPPTPADAEIVDVPTFVQANDRASKVKFVAVQVPRGTTRARVGLIGGKVLSTPVRGGRYIVYVGTGRPPVWTSFRIPGNPTLECGSGALSTRDELRDPVISGNAEGAAWFCDYVDA